MTVPFDPRAFAPCALIGMVHLRPLPGKVRSSAKAVARAKAILSRRLGKHVP